MQNTSTPLEPDLVLHERYKIMSPLGQGGMSRVYLATDLPLSVRVAIKENLQTDPQARTQFHHEAEFLARLSHPNLPRVTDYFDDAATGRQYLVMDYIEGEDLNAMVKRTGPIPEKQAVNYIVQVLDALEYMHSQQPPIIHRDIKPSNIKLTRQGKAVLVDFGIAKEYEDTSMTLTGARAVSPGFAPPEQYGMHTDARSDIYAVGATLYTLLTGQVPPESTLRVANVTPMPPPRTLAPQLSPQVDAAIEHAMEPDTKRRWNDADSFRAALVAAETSVAADAATVALQSSKAAPPRPAASPEPVTPPTVHVTPPPARSSPNRLPLILGALVLLLALAGGAFFLTRNNNSTASTAPIQVAAAVAPAATPSPTSSASTATSQPNASPTAHLESSATLPPNSTVTASAPTAEAGATAQEGGAASPTLSAASSDTPIAASPTAQAASTEAPSAAAPSQTSVSAPTQVPTQVVAAISSQAPDSIAVTGFRLDPAEPKRGQDVKFNVTFQNTFADTRPRTWSIWIYPASDLRRRFWDSKPVSSDLSVGENVVSTLPNNLFRVTGRGGPEDYVAYVEFVGEDGGGVPVTNPDGTPFTITFTVNP